VIDAVAQSGLRAAAAPHFHGPEMASCPAGRRRPEVRGLQRRRRRAGRLHGPHRVGERSSPFGRDAHRRLRDRRHRRFRLPAMSTRWPSKSLRMQSTRPKTRPVGRKHFDTPGRSTYGPPRRGRLHLRRGNRPDRIARRPCRRAARQAAVSGDRRLWGKPTVVNTSRRGPASRDIITGRRLVAEMGTSVLRARQSSPWKVASRTPDSWKFPSALRFAS